jgi:hypothetical protein
MKPYDDQLRVDLIDSGYRDSNDGEYPFLVSAQALIGAGSAPNVESLRAAQNCPVEVNEIRFTFGNEDTSKYALGTDGDYTGSNMYYNLGGVIAAQFSLGSAPLTAGMVPIGVLCHPGNLGQDGCHFRWKLPYPIYVPAGELIQPAFSSNFDRVFGVRVSYCGRTALNKKPPKSIRLPYVSAYRAPAMLFDGTSVTYNSTERDLVNGLNVPLNMTHFVGRAYLMAVAGSAFYWDQPWILDEAIASIKLKMLRSDGFSCIKSLIPIYSAFFGAGRKFVCPHIMPPKTHYKVTITNSGKSCSISTTVFQSLAEIALHGWREVAI